MSEKQTVSQKAKTHLKKHRAKYITGGVCLVVGGTIGAYMGNKGIINLQLVNTGSVTQSLYIDKSINILSRRGHAGNIIKCKETGEIFSSQNHAARLLKINKSELSKHLRGLQDNVKGYTFDKLGDFNEEQPEVFEKVS